ncbi:MAG: hypothetical protein R2825_27840 [Saprospiraceae bacterium]
MAVNKTFSIPATDVTSTDAVAEHPEIFIIGYNQIILTCLGDS